MRPKDNRAGREAKPESQQPHEGKRVRSCGDSRGYSHEFKNAGVIYGVNTPAVLWMGGADGGINSQSP